MKMKTIWNVVVLSLLSVSILSCSKEEADLGPLQADFTVDKQEIAAGDSVMFSDRSQGMPSRLQWIFEGGSPDTSILANPAVVYELPGTYKVTLVATRGDASHEVVREDYITVGYGPLTADFATANTTVYIQEEIAFANLTKGVATSWEWVFKSADHEIKYTDREPKVVFENPGVYDVTLTVSNPGYSDKTEKIGYLTVLDPRDLKADFDAAYSTVPTGYDVRFFDASIGLAESWHWEFEGASSGTSNEKEPVVRYAAPGMYRVKLTVSNEYTSKTVVKEKAIRVVDNTDLALLIPFDRNVTDLSANALSPQVQGEAPSFNGADRSGATGKAASFAGAGGLVIPDHDALNFSNRNYTISVWVRSSNTSRMMVWQESGKNGTGDNQTWLRLGDNTTDRKMRFNTEDATGGFILNSDRSVTDGKWNHVVCVRNGNRSSIYVNGALVREGTTNTVKVVSNGAPFKIALQEMVAGFDNYFKGDLDDLIIYRKALSETEVKSLFEY
ncbi:PKD repeat protein [Sphingobacterium allocomposti]|uniref:PKD repeat protein n=1 Tax=Sphingobacterium allocomposti TaxID=415956 RepID=A0A5S5DP37_9SPHI|nr:LamG-like jellyroll fold domain-containing protein [Sphingobacterium composti Yoo et al. 2007 non Ten et al. 2007]TYP96796.1 PKD repeat protein [Sphingobacterium composti Yoo et al. 2007 non Ten et al. 2007]